MIAVFDDPAVALDAGRRIHGVLLDAAGAPGGGADIAEVRHGAPSAPPLTAPEAEFLAEIGVATPNRGFGWLGPDRASGPAVSVVGAVATVADLAYVDADTDEVNPLHDALLALGATRTIGELDWAFDLGAVADVACAAPEPVPHDDLRDVADYLAVSWAYDVTAPWDGPLGQDEQALRRSHRMLEERRRAAGQLVFDDPNEVARSVDGAIRRGDDPAEAVRDAVASEGSFDPEILDGLHPTVVRWFIERQVPVAADAEAEVRAERRRVRSAVLGAPDVEPGSTGHRFALGYGAMSRSWRIDLNARPATMTVTGLSGNALARTLPRLVAYLLAIGCDDLTIDVTDNG